MAQHTITTAQNIFDVAIQLHGSIEGIYDLLISNPGLSMDTDLHPGDTLEYHDYFVLQKSIVDDLMTRGIIVANGERNYSFTPHQVRTPVLEIITQPDTARITLDLSGSGIMLVDWENDGSTEAVNLSRYPGPYIHVFVNPSDYQRVIKIYGSFSIESWDMSKLNGRLYWLTGDGGNNYWTNQK